MIASVVRPLGLLLCGACVVLLAATASAESAGEPPEYRYIVREALSEFDAGHFAEARALFVRAHRLQPSARTLRGLGLSSFELREYRAAIDYLEAALASDVHPLDPSLRTATTEVVARAQGFVGRYALSLTPEHAELRLDGVPVAPEPTLTLALGQHVLDVAAAGYRPERRIVLVLGGENEPLDLALKPVAPPVAIAPTNATTFETAPSRSERAHDAAEPLYRNGWLWVGIGVVAVAVSIAIGVAAHSTRTTVGGVAHTDHNPTGAVLSALIQ